MLTGSELYSLLVLRKQLDESSMQRILALVPGIRGKINRMSRMFQENVINNTQPKIRCPTPWDEKAVAIRFHDAILQIDTLTQLPSALIRKHSRPRTRKLRLHGSCQPYCN